MIPLVVLIKFKLIALLVYFAVYSDFLYDSEIVFDQGCVLCYLYFLLPPTGLVVELHSDLAIW